MTECLSSIEILRRQDHDGLAALLDDALRTFRSRAAEQLAETCLGRVELPYRLAIRHTSRLIGLVWMVNGVGGGH